MRKGKWYHCQWCQRQALEQSWVMSKTSIRTFMSDVKDRQVPLSLMSKTSIRTIMSYVNDTHVSLSVMSKTSIRLIINDVKDKLEPSSLMSMTRKNHHQWYQRQTGILSHVKKRARTIISDVKDKLEPSSVMSKTSKTPLTVMSKASLNHYQWC